MNTGDNRFRYSSSLSLIWVTGGDPVDQWNEAWALASCTNCKTVAIAFQVVLIVGSSPIVTPVNSAVAVNYECQACITHALAEQLVLTLTGEPTPATLADLKAAWEQLQKESTGFHALSLVEVRQQLEAAQKQLAQILAPYIARPTTTTGATGTTGTTGTTARTGTTGTGTGTGTLSTSTTSTATTPTATTTTAAAVTTSTAESSTEPAPTTTTETTSTVP